ncbi:hypothetical protein F4678DRAFT_57830 [Xylaria arbuscula]|nr:hypothetical protein F4678DRAFT_57830 [Xylaria arbuscula]
MTSPDLLDPRLRSPKSANLASSQTKGHLQEDDESEWEYEYSTTETETFYVTLDLSKADFKAQEQNKSKLFPSRGSWQTLKASELFLNRRLAIEKAQRNSGASSAASSDAERDDEDQTDLIGEGRGKRGSDDQQVNGEGEEEDSASHERVQILELHSDNPIISYKGRVFSGQWCENTTTEFLLTRHDEENDVPVLKHLDDGVDLLAASACRINVKEQQFKPKDSDSENQRASAQIPATIIPPVDPKATQERIDQRNFLANLIALKKRKGETDDVTILARSMQGRNPNKVKRPKGPRTLRRGRLTAVRGSEGRGGNRKGSGRPRGKWALFPLGERTRDPMSGSSSRMGSPADGDFVSTPTPYRWDELGAGQGSSPVRMGDLIEVDPEDEQDEDEGDDDDNNDIDEDEEDDQDEMDEDED